MKECGYSYLYVIGPHDGEGPIKVGVSRDPPRRAKEVGYRMVVRHTVKLSIAQVFAAEKEAHRLLRLSRRTWWPDCRARRGGPELFNCSLGLAIDAVELASALYV